MQSLFYSISYLGQVKLGYPLKVILIAFCVRIKLMHMLG